VPGRHSVKVCLGTACHVRGGSTLLDCLQNGLGVVCGETTPDRRYDLDRVACLGCCALSPVVQINGKIFSKITVNKLTELLKYYE
jgi:NADH-quinone oxidoreductase subunit E